MANNYGSLVENSQYKIRGLVPFYYRLRNCDTNLTANTPANQRQRVKIINNTTGVASSLYTMNIGALTAYKKPLDSRGGVCWNQMSDRPVPSVQRATVPTGYNNSSNRRHGSVTSSRPGGQTPGGVGCDVKHNSYDRYLNRLKGKGPLRRGSLSNLEAPLYGGKDFKPSIVEGCDCPIVIDDNIDDNTDIIDEEKEFINPNAVFFNRSGIKRALVVGINYELSPNLPTLRGCIYDADNIIRNFIKPVSQINRLTDESNSIVLPTKSNILTAIDTLSNGAISGDHLFFFYSGHGARSAYDSTNVAESDFQDEFICPWDEMYIRDNDLRQKINLLPAGVVLFMVFDCCNSGTICDLKYRYEPTSYTESNMVETAGTVIVLSGCTDPQSSFEWVDGFGPNSIPQGALTWAFLQCINTPDLTWRMLLTSMLALLKANNITEQTPVLSSGRFIDIDTKINF